MNENQKKTTDEYRNNWDSIFKKKEKQDEDKASPPGGLNQQSLDDNR